jgi:type II secretory pathway pseudopilin PulG
VSDREGFSLLELLVASACTGLLAAGVFSLLLAGAGTGRRGWSVLTARVVSESAVAALARDVREAGRGLEGATAVQLSGERIPTLSATPGGLRLLRGAGPALEISAQVAAYTYEIAGDARIAAGDHVAGLDLPRRPAGAPLPAATVVASLRGAGVTRVVVAWSAAEAPLLDDWGAPRALLVLEDREYALLALDEGLQLRRRDEGGSWQPVADRLEALELAWLVDEDGDRAPDRRLPSLPPGREASVCAVDVLATVRPAKARELAAGAAAGEPIIARRTVRAGPCQG